MLRVATRGSKLALGQTQLVTAMLKPFLGAREISIEIIKTRGDIRQDVSLIQLGEGVFVKALEEELLAGRADIAIHSLKDLPSTETPRLTIGAVPAREDPRDAIVTRDRRHFGDLQSGALLATGSPRRIAQLRALRPDLQFIGVRGNVDTRLRKLDSGEFDGLVIAVAGMNRLGLGARITTVLEKEQCVPAVGQGALAVQCRADDQEVTSLLESIDNAATHTEITAERSFLSTIGGGCRVPVGAIAQLDGETLEMCSVVSDLGGQHISRSKRSAAADEAVQLGQLAAGDLAASMEHLVKGSSIRT